MPSAPLTDTLFGVSIKTPVLKMHKLRLGSEVLCPSSHAQGAAELEGASSCLQFLCPSLVKLLSHLGPQFPSLSLMTRDQRTRRTVASRRPLFIKPLIFNN